MFKNSSSEHFGYLEEIAERKQWTDEADGLKKGTKGDTLKHAKLESGKVPNEETRKPFQKATEWVV